MANKFQIKVEQSRTRRRVHIPIRRGVFQFVCCCVLNMGRSAAGREGSPLLPEFHFRLFLSFPLDDISYLSVEFADGFSIWFPAEGRQQNWFAYEQYYMYTGIGMDGGGCCRWLLLLLLFDIGMRVNSIKRGFSSNWTPIYLISLSDIYGDILVQGMCSVQRVYMHLWYVNLFAARLRPNRFPRKSNEDGIPEYSMAEVGCRSSELQRCVIHSLRGVPD